MTPVGAQGAEVWQAQLRSEQGPSACCVEGLSESKRRAQGPGGGWSPGPGQDPSLQRLPVRSGPWVARP